MVKKFTLPELPYDFAALEPIISAEIMQLHYSKHHNAYVTNLNTALEKYADAEVKDDIAAMILQQQAIRFNGGGHVNHSIFWTNLAPQNSGGGQLKQGELSKAIDQEYGSLQTFIEKFSLKTAGIQGSGWGWLVFDKATKRIRMESSPNQDPPSTISSYYVPLLGIDVWEHAYYLQYKNARPDYLKAIWSIINWQNVEERYLNAKK